jgi:uncharacterized RDD family membrane protein YckC
VTAAPPPSSASVGWESPNLESGPAPGIEYAPHGGRLVAYIIDSFIIGLAVSVMLLVGFVALGTGLSIDTATNTVDLGAISAFQWFVFGFMTLLAMVIGLLYFPFFWARSGQTPGMRLFDLHVVQDRDGAPIGWGTALLRLVGLWVAGVVFYLGYIWIFIDKRHRGWQDLIAGTVVIKRS